MVRRNISGTGRLALVRDDSGREEAPGTGDGVADGGPGGRNGRRPTGVRRLLQFPLFGKILVANVAIVALVTLACGVVAHSALAAGDGVFVVLLGAGVVLSAVSNAVILRLALSPLRQLERTAEQVNTGDLAARVPPSDLADREMQRLAATFNSMLDSGDAYRGRLRDIAARALNASEEERKRIARELHDGTAQTLAALRVRLRVARLTDEASDRDALLQRIGADLGEATEEIRRIAQGLRPPALDMLGLAPAIESLARGIDAGGDLQVETDIASVDGLLSPEVELALYRIIQEALSNVVRHSGASAARVTLDAAGSSVSAVVEDRGRGFDVANEMSRGGLGLYGMQERGAYVGAAVDIVSEPGRGTRIRVTIPSLEAARYA
jgi:two-component system, NarL family, sensor histidine kinase UhpB